MQTDDEMRAIAAGMKRAGLTNRAIAERLGISLRAAKTLCASLGAKRPPGRTWRLALFRRVRANARPCYTLCAL